LDTVEDDMRGSIRMIREYLARAPNDPTGQEELVRFLDRLAGHLNALSRPGDAEDLGRQAVVESQKLVRAFPSSFMYRNTLANVYNTHGRSLSGLGKYSEAAEQHRRAAALGRELTSEFPGDLLYGSALIHSLVGQSHAERQSQNPAAAEQTARAALAAADRLAVPHAWQADVVVQRTTALEALMHALEDQGRYDDVLAPARERVTLLEKLQTAHPDVPEFAGNLALARVYLARYLAKLGEEKEAEALLRRVYSESQGLKSENAESVRGFAGFELVQVFRQLGQWAEAERWADLSVADSSRRHERNRTSAEIKGILCQSHWYRAIARDHLGRYAEAAADWGEAAKLADVAMDRAFYLAHRGSSLARGGDSKGAASEFAAAVRGAEAALKAKELDGITYYDAAGVYALAAGGTTDPAAAEKYAAEAVVLLGRAAGVGYLSDPAQRKTLRAADEYAPLHAREDFKKLLAGLEKK
jgi:tetratricopeptide (TPR) repeat protein